MVVITLTLERIMKLKKLVEALAHSGLPAAREGLARTRFPAARDIVLGARSSFYTYRTILFL
jgi:hypothetical protein